MKKLDFTKWVRSQSGFTLIEIVIGIAISGILGAGVASVIFQIGSVNSIDNARVTAVKQVENSLHYINRDMQMAQIVQANGQNYWLRLSWTTWADNENIVVTYVLQNGQLTRSSSLNGGNPTVSTVGKYITAVSAVGPNTSAVPPEKAWNITLTASTSSQLKQATEIRQLNIVPRPGS